MKKKITNKDLNQLLSEWGKAEKKKQVKELSKLLAKIIKEESQKH